MQLIITSISDDDTANCTWLAVSERENPVIGRAKTRIYPEETAKTFTFSIDTHNRGLASELR
jgi:hypothetical protein